MSDKRSKRKAYRRRSNNNKKIIFGFVLILIIVVIGAYFILNNPSIYTLDINVEGSGNISKNPDRDHYNYNEEISLTAAASEGWLFGGWSGDFAGLSNPANIVLDENKTVIATFIEQTEPVKVLLTTNRGDISATLIHIYRGGKSSELETMLSKYVDEEAVRLPIYEGKVGLLVDSSYSTKGYGEREYAIISQTVAFKKVFPDTT